MTIAKMPFGRLGHPSTRTLFGAAALSNVSQAEADRTLDAPKPSGVSRPETVVGVRVAGEDSDAVVDLAPPVAHNSVGVNQLLVLVRENGALWRKGEEQRARAGERLDVPLEPVAPVLGEHGE